MKAKIVTGALGVLLALSVAGNVYIVSQQQTISARLAEQREQAAALTAQIERDTAEAEQMKTQLAQINAEITAAQEETAAAKEQAATLAAVTPTPATTPPAPVANAQSPAAQNPTAAEVDALLREVLGDYGESIPTPSVPSNPSDGTGWGNVMEADPTLDGSGLGHAGTGSLDAWK
ncbi:hypothetical protein [Anaerotruncus rubiinfantis]|jgi:TolA-binding protein|uniref:hypothetical protein n=1 Tax=Anaerotruncus rubiinfantis TaxID=1720200 RepID=UPI00189A561B|nr:hypothetical protein [Anaerotruncus rubiinfantis]